jgi:hypothetical protein
MVSIEVGCRTMKRSVRHATLKGYHVARTRKYLAWLVRCDDDALDRVKWLAFIESYRLYKIRRQAQQAGV